MSLMVFVWNPEPPEHWLEKNNIPATKENTS